MKELSKSRFLSKFESKSKSKSKKKSDLYILCLLTFQPSELLIQLFADLYDPNDPYALYIIVDDISFDISSYIKKYPYITFVQHITEEECYASGYYNMNYMVKGAKPSAWDKAIYYFSEKDGTNIDFDHIWFIEDDVMIPTRNTIREIDNTYKDDDILAENDVMVSHDWKPSKEVFQHTPNTIHTYLYKSMVCAIRLSKKMFQHIHDYVKRYKKLFFLESFFHTLAHMNHIHVRVIPELSTIIYRKKWDITHINPNFLYHPVKYVDQQYTFRKFFQPNMIYLSSYHQQKFHNHLAKFNLNLNSNMKRYLLQTYAFQIHDSFVIKIIQKENDYMLQNEYTLKDGKIYIYSIHVSSWNDAYTYILNMNSTYLYYQTTLVEEYQVDDILIRVHHSPGVLPYIQLESYSHYALMNFIKKSGIRREYMKGLDEIFAESSAYFGTNISPVSSFLYSKIEKSIAYIQKNKKEYKKLVELQKKKYDDYIKEKSNIKVRNNVNFKYA